MGNDHKTTFQVDPVGSFQAIEALLGKRIGLRKDALGHSNLINTIAKSMAAAGVTDAVAYLQHLKNSPTALAALIEATVVPETSFFRNSQSFDYLRHHILSTSRRRSAPLRVLSIPCSTGEEPYSIAITLMESGLSLDDFSIDALDVSTQALEKAQQGIFTSYSFRKTSTYSPERHIQQYFQKKGKFYHLSQHVRSQVQFHYGNLAHRGCLRQTLPYDIIFCRNLLIYFHQAARDLALQNIDRLLRPEGLLFVGYADTVSVAQTRFELVRAPHAFVYKKSLKQPVKIAKLVTNPADVVAGKIIVPNRFGSAAQPISAGKVSTRKISTVKIDSQTIAAARLSASLSRQSSTLKKTSSPPVGELERIRNLADIGQLDDAYNQCKRYLQRHPVQAAAYLLLGEIYQAKEDYALADQSFQKSLYLNPSCQQSLIHRIQLAEQQSNDAEAQRLRLRLKRLSSKQDLSSSQAD